MLWRHAAVARSPLLVLISSGPRGFLELTNTIDVRDLLSTLCCATITKNRYCAAKRNHVLVLVHIFTLSSTFFQRGHLCLSAERAAGPPIHNLFILTYRFNSHQRCWAKSDLTML